MAKPTTNVVYPVQVSKGNTLYIEAHGSFLTKKNIQRQLKNLGYKKFTITKPIPLKDFKNMSSKVKTIKLKPAIGNLKGVPKPPAQAGLNFKVVFGIDTDAACSIVAAAGDAFYGNIKVISTTADNTEIQEVARATAVATPANFDNLDFAHDVTTLGGFAGDSVELICDSADAWHVNAVLGVEGDPGTIAVINAG